MRPVLKFVPTARAGWLFVAASVLFLVSAPAALAADLLVALFIVLDARRSSLADIERTAPRSVPLGGTGLVELRVRAKSRRTVQMSITDDIDTRLTRSGPPVDRAGDDWERGVRVSVRPGVTTHARYRVRAAVRGIMRLGDIHARVDGPWALASRRVVIPAAATMRVVPEYASGLRRRGHPLHRTLRQIGPRRTIRRGEGREFESLRDYVRGDDPRFIDWKSSARRGNRVVRSYEAERSQNLVLAFDAGRHMRESVAGRERADLALSAGMTMARRAELYGDRVGWMVFDQQIRQVAPPRRVSLGRLAETLAAVETRLVEPNYPLAFAQLSRAFRKRSLVVLFCDIIDSRVSGALVESMSRLAGYHLPLAVAIQNPDLEQVASAPVDSERAAYRRAAAVELRQARTTALEGMRRAGILVVDTQPGEALIRTLEKYAEVKERGLL